MRKLSKNASVYAVMAFAALTLLAVTGHAQEPQEAGDPDKYLLLSTNRTGTMEEELNAAGARGYRVAGAQGGETAFGGDEAVVIMRLDPEGRRFRYILLATSRTGTMQEELNAVPPDYELVAMTVFRSTFGGSEAAAILEAELVEGVPQDDAVAVAWYRKAAERGHAVAQYELGVRCADGRGVSLGIPRHQN